MLGAFDRVSSPPSLEISILGERMALLISMFTTRPPAARPQSTKQPTHSPTNQPTNYPTNQPTNNPTKYPTTVTNQPTNQRITKQPTDPPTYQPTRQPTNQNTNLGGLLSVPYLFQWTPGRRVDPPRRVAFSPAFPARMPSPLIWPK